MFRLILTILLLFVCIKHENAETHPYVTYIYVYIYTHTDIYCILNIYVHIVRFYAGPNRVYIYIYILYTHVVVQVANNIHTYT